MLHPDLYFEVVTLTWKFHSADWFRSQRCNLVMNTEKVKAASPKQSHSVGLHAVSNASDNGSSLCVFGCASLSFLSFVCVCRTLCSGHISSISLLTSALAGPRK